MIIHLVLRHVMRSNEKKVRKLQENCFQLTPGFCQFIKMGMKEYMYAFHLPLPFAVASVNTYFVPGPVPTLIDVPPNDRAAKEHLERALSQVGYSIQDIARIIVTHPHFDHFGSAPWIVSRSGAEVWVSKDGAKHLEHPEEELEKDFAYYCRFLEWAGTPNKGEEYLRGFYDAAQDLGPAVKVTKRLEHGDRIDLGSCQLTVISVPGHTPWCTLFYDTQRGVAFTGDFLIKEISSNAVIQRPFGSHERYKSLRTYVSSLQQVRQLGLQKAFPGHGEEITDVAGRIDEILSLARDRQDHIVTVLRQGSSTPYEIMNQIFSNLADWQVMLGISEVIGNLEILEEQGAVKREKGQAVFYLARN
jgi:glyoxylase-like metal-dependent hydrolase (beta-lactamase superfamily II)